MKISGDYTFNGAREDVWALLHDPDVLKNAMPGMQEMTREEDDTYTGEMHVKVGPVNGTFQNKITLSNQEPPERYTMEIQGQGPPGRVQGDANVRLEEAGPETTVMHYEAELRISGRIQRAGQRLLDSVSKSMTQQSLDALNEALQARLHADRADAAEAEAEPAEASSKGPGGPEAPPRAEPRAQTGTYTPPSQADFARNVARDVATDLWNENRGLVLGLSGLLGVLIGLFFWRRS